MIHIARRVALVSVVMVSMLFAILFATTGSRSVGGQQEVSIDPDVVAAVATGGSARVDIVLRDARPIPRVSSADEERRLVEGVAEAHRAFRGAVPERGIRIVRQYQHVATLLAEIDARGLQALARHPMVRSIQLVRPVRLHLTEGVPLIRADALWARGFTGAGLTAAVLDTGIDYTNPALGGCVGPNCKVLHGENFCLEGEDPFDDAPGHGTSVAGIIAANLGTLRGVAPDAKLLALKVAGGTCIDMSGVAAGLQWVLDHRLEYNIKVANMSLGDGFPPNYTKCHQGTIPMLIQSLVSNGVAVTVSAGNEGWNDGVGFPACVPEATAVGAVYDNFNLGTDARLPCIAGDRPTHPDQFTCFSNAGDDLDLLAPSWATNTTIAHGHVPQSFTGTSAAAPYVAGAYLLMRQALPSVTVTSLEEAFKLTGVSVPNRTGGTYPRIDVLAASLEFDVDHDGIVGNVDNCPFASNAGQADADGDGLGDACDNCPELANAGQENADSDPAGDVCDCDDINGVVYPGAPEVCDGMNNDCGDISWPGLRPETDYDFDGVPPCGGDCNDLDASIHPGAPELCDGIDNDCSGGVSQNELDADGDGYRPCGGDCDDSRPAVHPGAPELCNGLNDDCVGGVPANEADGDGDGFRICEGDCGDTSPAVHPGATELCNGVDDDCAAGIPGDEADVDGDGKRICEGDCADGDPAVFPGSPEVCDGRNNDCDDPSWPGLGPETDSDLDGLAPCGGDCNDSNAAVRPGLPEVCDDLDNDCNGSIDVGFPYLASAVRLATTVDSGGSAADRFGSAVLGLPDVTGDAVPDYAVASGADDVAGAVDAGSVSILSGATHQPVRRLTRTAGLHDAIAEFGSSLALAGDLDGDGITDLAIGHAGATTFGVLDDATLNHGEIAFYSAAAGALIGFYRDSPLQMEGRLGASLAAADLDNDGLPEIVAGAPGDCPSFECGGRIEVIDPRSRTLRFSIGGPASSTGDRFGADVAVTPDIDGDSRADIVVGSPGISGGSGSVIVLSGATGDFILSTGGYGGAEFGSSVAGADLNGDGIGDFMGGSPLRDTGAGQDAGDVSVVSGAGGAVLFTLTDPQGSAGDRFGSDVAVIGDIDRDLIPEILVGAPLDDTAAGIDAGSVLMFSGRTGALIRRFDNPSGSPGDRLGSAVAGMAALDADGLPEVISGAPFGDVTAGVDAGFVLIDSTHVSGDCDGDGVPNGSDNCRLIANAGQLDAEADGVGDACDNCRLIPNPGQDVIPPRVVYPNGGEFVTINDMATLRWNACSPQVDVLLSRNGVNGTYATLYTNIDNTLSQAWTVTAPKTTGATAFLKVVEKTAGAAGASDKSDAGFTVRRFQDSGCGSCSASFCDAPNVRCSPIGTCGVGGCCNYTCSTDLSCTAPDPCPPNVCGGC